MLIGNVPALLAAFRLAAPAQAPSPPPAAEEALPEVGEINPALLQQLLTLSAQALAIYGPEAQFEQFNEEIGEYLTARARRWRNRSTEEDVLEETVDVFIRSVVSGVGHYGAAAFNEMLERKLGKFEQKLVDGFVEID